MQFLPQDPSKILVTSADSKVRIIDGVNVIGKYKGKVLNVLVSLSENVVNDLKLSLNLILF